MRLLTAGSLVRVQLGEPKKADTLMRIGFSFAILWTRTNDKLLQIWLRQIWQKQSVDCFVAGCTALVRCGKVPFRRMCMCAPYLSFYKWTRTNDKLLQIWLRQIWQKQSGGLFRSRLHNLGARVDKRPFFYFSKLSEIGNEQQMGTV